MRCRLVYFLPAIADVYDPAEIPTHPMLCLVANCEQVLSTRYSRRLITMEKVRAYDAVEVAAFHEAAGPPRMAVDDLHAHVYAARPGPDGAAAP